MTSYKLEYTLLYHKIIDTKKNFTKTEYDRFLVLLKSINRNGVRTIDMPDYYTYIGQIKRQIGLKYKHKDVIISFD
tara:strand:- start:214 stop:441 length:228 start_codon:yes stop_codon:yes gene_type:complete